MLSIHEAIAVPRAALGGRLAEIADFGEKMRRAYDGALEQDPRLTRKIVSFQANKERPRFRWYKFKEAFSADLVEYLLDAFGVDGGAMLDPFAGMGTAIFACADRGLNADGIEVLPVGSQIIKAHKTLSRDFSAADLASLQLWQRAKMWRTAKPREINTLRITRGAYPPAIEKDIGKYAAAADGETNPRVKTALRFALLCILEEVSYTRKDGQFLRWDNRSGRELRQFFHKGTLPSFPLAISGKIGEIIADLRKEGMLWSDSAARGEVALYEGSCLHILPRLPAARYRAVMTSPPYCNRYDYTRTYALELAMLGATEEKVKELRQTMLSCTVENRAKDLTAINPQWRTVIAAAERHPCLQIICEHLRKLKAEKQLNNAGLIQMVEGYFREMACIIAECARVLQPGGVMFMVNDNVRIGGAEIPVDLILSDFANHLGFTVQKILVLPQSKGNSSQQMGAYGRAPLRKCVYIWRRR